MTKIVINQKYRERFKLNVINCLFRLSFSFQSHNFFQSLNGFCILTRTPKFCHLTRSFINNFYLAYIFQHLLKEEKIIVASKQWGSFFRHDKNDANKISNCQDECVNTFWANVIREHCKIAIPLLDYLTGLALIIYLFLLKIGPSLLFIYSFLYTTIYFYHPLITYFLNHSSIWSLIYSFINLPILLFNHLLIY